MTLEIFFSAITLLYFFTHLFLLYGLKKSLNLKKDNNSKLPRVTVIVAARNESGNILQCIDSLAKLNYSEDLLEIILVNDQSTDNTFEIMKSATKDLGFFKIINSSENFTHNLKGKANAIDTAISQSTGDIIVSTDADCEVPSDWVLETVKYFSANTGMVCGFTMIKPDKTIFSKLQCLDWMYLLTLASSSAGLKMILSCLGNNLSFSRKCYNDVGGYSAVGFSVTEDLALMRKIDSYKSVDIKFPVDKDCLVKTVPCDGIAGLFSQKRRWFRGGIGINFLGYIIGIEMYIVNILLVFGLFFLNIKLYFLLIIIKMLSDLLLISKVLNRFDLLSLYKYYPLFCLYFAAYGLALPLSFLFGTKIKWKGREF